MKKSYNVHLLNVETGNEWVTTLHTSNILFDGDEIMVDGWIYRIIKITEV